MGFAGAHIGGHGLTYETLEQIIDNGEALASRWQEFIAEFDYPQQDGFYFFEKDGKNGLNRESTAPKREKPARPFIVLL